MKLIIFFQDNWVCRIGSWVKVENGGFTVRDNDLEKGWDHTSKIHKNNDEIWFG